MVTSHYTPADPLYANVAFYTVGGLGAFSMLGVGMAYEAKWSRQEEPPRPASSAAEPWPKQYPRLITFLALAGEVAVLSVFARIVARDQTTVEPKRTVLPIITLALVAFRILVLLTLLAFQFPPFYRANFVAPNANEAAPATERTPLLANANASANGGGGGGGTSLSGPTTDPAATGGSVLRGSRLPSNRPPDPKSLSILTLFSRVKLLFPYLWPAKSLVLQILALICFGLMLFRRYVNVLQPILFGRVISALANGKPPFVPIVLYVIFSFLQDSNTMLYRYRASRVLLPSILTLHPPADSPEPLCYARSLASHRAGNDSALRYMFSYPHNFDSRFTHCSTRSAKWPSCRSTSFSTCRSRTTRAGGPGSSFGSCPAQKQSTTCVTILLFATRWTGGRRLTPPRAQFFELLLFSFVPILIDLPVAFLVLWVRYGITIVGVVTVVAVV
jgi:hypothetical protein